MPEVECIEKAGNLFDKKQETFCKANSQLTDEVLANTNTLLFDT